MATVAGLNGFVAVAAGAFGAHALKSRIGVDALTVFETAARYHMYHALGLLGVACLIRAATRRRFQIIAILFQSGIVLFCGSLYAMGLSNLRWKWLGGLTPFGGGCFLLGWLLLAVWSVSLSRRQPAS